MFSRLINDDIVWIKQLNIGIPYYHIIIYIVFFINTEWILEITSTGG